MAADTNVQAARGIGAATAESMMDLALIVLALLAGGFAVELFAATLAKAGPADEHGFHLGFEAYHHAES